MTWRVVIDNYDRTGPHTVMVEARTHAEAKRKGAAAYRAQTGKRKAHVVSVYNSGTSNPIPKGKFIPVQAVRLNRNGTISLKVSSATARKLNPRKRNVEMGFYNATGFHPIRSSHDYDPDLASDDYGDFGSGVKKKRKPAKKKAKAKRKR